MKDRAYYQKVKEGENLTIVSCITASGRYMTPILILIDQSLIGGVVTKKEMK